MDCRSTGRRSTEFPDKNIELRNVLDSKPVGYRVKFQYISIGFRDTCIQLFSTERIDPLDLNWANYYIGIVENIQELKTL